MFNKMVMLLSNNRSSSSLKRAKSERSQMQKSLIANPVEVVEHSNDKLIVKLKDNQYVVTLRPGAGSCTCNTFHIRR